MPEKSGRIDPSRDHVLTGMEMHVPCRRIGPDDLRGLRIRVPAAIGRQRSLGTKRSAR